MFETSDEWIQSRTGMRERRIGREDENTSDMALAASLVALDRAGLQPSDIDCIIVATVTPDFVFPATACILGSKLGIEGKPGFDLEIACSGFIYGLTVASSMVRSGLFRRILLVGAEKLSSVTNYEDRATAILFGDGAGAAILEASDEDSFLSAELGANGADPTALYIPAGGTREPLTKDAIDARRGKIAQNGREVFKFAVNTLISVSDKAIAKAGLTYADIDWLIPHQANRRIIDAAAKHLDLPPEKIVINIDRYGNTSAASVPIAMSEAWESGKLKKGDTIIFVGFGGGLSWGALAWKWAI